MTENQLVMFNAIVQEGSFKKASESLFKSQSALSLGIKNLEEELGFALFSRAQYRPEITRRGRQFYERSVKLVASFEELESFGKELGQFNDPIVSLSIDSIFPLEIIEQILKNFKTQSPATKIRLSSDILDGGIEKLKEGEVDFCLAPDFSIDESMIVLEHITIEFAAVIAPVLMKDLKQPQALGTVPQIIVKSSARRPGDFTVGVLKDGHHWFVSDQSLKKEFVIRGMGWGNFPLHQVRQELHEGKLIFLDQFRPRHFQPLKLVRMKNRALGKNAQHLWELFRQVKPLHQSPL